MYALIVLQLISNGDNKGNVIAILNILFFIIPFICSVRYKTKYTANISFEQLKCNDRIFLSDIQSLIK